MAALAEEADAVAEAVPVDTLGLRAQECVAPAAVAEAVRVGALGPQVEDGVATAGVGLAEVLVVVAVAARTQ